MLLKGHQFRAILVLAGALVLLNQCASPRSPTGGPKDETPPSVIKEESTPNYQTLFEEKEITITFDEWITLKDIYTQLVISPLMPDEPEIKQKGKSILITLPDSLKEETTYTIHFGNAIADLNEGNALENFYFVFSTGSVLDSIQLSGKVIDAMSLKPSEGTWVMLYPPGEDSAVYKRKPEYLAKTNKEGKWSIGNIRSDSFNVVALKDENLNFLYDQEAELFGWLNETVYTNTPAANLPEIKLFPREKRISIREIIHGVPGWIKIVVDGPFPKLVPDMLPRIENSIAAWSGDTLHIWYSPTISYSGYALINNDSTQVRIPVGTSLQKSNAAITAVTGRLHPSATALFSLEVPVAGIDTSKIMLTHDTLGSIPFSIAKDSLDIRKLTVNAIWPQQTRSTITFLPGAVTDFWGRTHDTIRQSIVVNSLDQFGELTLNVSGLDSAGNYFLLIKSGEQLLDQIVIERLKSMQIKKPAMPPGKYTIEIIEDRNNNLRWDTGDYNARRQPEKKMIFTLDNLRAGWELESSLQWL